jgi:hypothetical protein
MAAVISDSLIVFDPKEISISLTPCCVVCVYLLNAIILTHLYFKCQVRSKNLKRILKTRVIVVFLAYLKVTLSIRKVLLIRNHVNIMEHNRIKKCSNCSGKCSEIFKVRIDHANFYCCFGCMTKCVGCGGVFAIGLLRHYIKYGSDGYIVSSFCTDCHKSRPES